MGISVEMTRHDDIVIGMFWMPRMGAGRDSNHCTFPHFGWFGLVLNTNSLHHKKTIEN